MVRFISAQQEKGGMAISYCEIEPKTLKLS